LALVSLLASAALVRGDAAAPDTPYMNGYDVALVQLNQPAAVTLPNGQTATVQQIHLIRLFGRFWNRSNDELTVLFGDEPFTGWRSFGSGVYLFVEQKPKLMSLAGRAIKYRFGSGPLISTAFKFEPSRFDLTTAAPLPQALERPLIKPRP
jgi:hypothetical protein